MYTASAPASALTLDTERWVAAALVPSTDTASTAASSTASILRRKEPMILPPLM